MVILVVALLVLGPQKLPEAARSVGKGMRELKQSLTADDDERDAYDYEEPREAKSSPAPPGPRTPLRRTARPPCGRAGTAAGRAGGSSGPRIPGPR